VKLKETIAADIFYCYNKKRLRYKTRRRLIFSISGGDIIDIPQGYITDFASIPWWARTLLNGDQAFIAALVHDYMYDTQYKHNDDPYIDRKFADLEFLRYMEMYKLPKFKRSLMYFAVRVGAKSWWNK
jgi:hypothetical protein